MAAAGQAFGPTRAAPGINSHKVMLNSYSVNVLSLVAPLLSLLLEVLEMQLF